MERECSRVRLHRERVGCTGSVGVAANRHTVMSRSVALQEEGALC